ncbi:hypothetical protein F5883DRAFT_691147 [Diaporthe sp. PMI_573]|nr:hypothetical protein F5883DRAFT_691147 [Diaporthaceae sp. PMI_573]
MAHNVATSAIVMDEEGTQAMLQLYCQPFEEVVPAKQTLRLGCCYLVKEPFAMVCPDGCYLRVDHPGDIFLLPHDHELLPVKWREGDAFLGSSFEMRMKGNAAVGKMQWAEAEDLYTTAAKTAETTEEARLAYLNRSLANLRLGRPATALADVIKSYGTGDSARTEKGLFREASALYELAKYDQCLDRLWALNTAYPDNSAMPMIHRAQARLEEQQTGKYDFRRMYKQAKATPPLIDCATYTAPVEIRNSPGKGRGLFTTKKVLAGEMLLCEKAFGHLHHGNYEAAGVYEVDGKPVIDSCHVAKAIALTGHRAPRDGLSIFKEIIFGEEQGVQMCANTSGVWAVMSHMNHSCISNVRNTFIGDMQIVRATRDFESGAEVFISYKEPKNFESYDDAQKRFSGWNFTCDCALCLTRKATSDQMLQKRRSLAKEFSQFTRNGIQGFDFVAAQRTLDRLNKTYTATEKEPGTVRFELWEPRHVLGALYTETGRPFEAVEEILKGLEALGFIISASPRRGVTKSSKPELRIIQWGLGHSFPVDAFRLLLRSYKTIAPENVPAARRYMETAYTIFVGEKERSLTHTRGLRAMTNHDLSTPFMILPELDGDLKWTEGTGVRSFQGRLS